MLDIDARHGGQVRWPASVSSVENLGVGVRSILQLAMGMVDTARHCCAVDRTGIGMVPWWFWLVSIGMGSIARQ